MSDVNFLFAGWEPVVRVLVVGTAMYVALVVLLRISGSRTIASMNVFDFLVTVAIGSSFGRAVTARPVALAEAVAAFLLLVVLQYVVGRAQTRWSRFEDAITNPPRLLYFRGEFRRDAMREQRLTRDELRAAVRKRNLGSMDDAEAIVLESNGDVSVIPSLGDGSALRDVPGERVERGVRGDR